MKTARDSEFFFFFVGYIGGLTDTPMSLAAELQLPEGKVLPERSKSTGLSLCSKEVLPITPESTEGKGKKIC